MDSLSNHSVNDISVSLNPPVNEGINRMISLSSLGQSVPEWIPEPGDVLSVSQSSEWGKMLVNHSLHQSCLLVLREVVPYRSPNVRAQARAGEQPSVLSL